MEDYRRIISDSIQQHMAIAGPAVAIRLARKVSSLTIADNGDVLDIAGDPKTALERLTETYISFAGETSKIILRSVLKIHPDITLKGL